MADIRRMLGYSVSLSCATAQPRELAEAVGKQLAGSLGRARARHLAVSDSRITCRGGMFRLVSRSNPLLPVSDVRIDIGYTNDAVEIRYALTFTQVQIIAFVGNLGAALTSLVSGHDLEWALKWIPLSLVLASVFIRFVGPIGFDNLVDDCIRDTGYRGRIISE